MITSKTWGLRRTHTQCKERIGTKQRRHKELTTVIGVETLHQTVIAADSQLTHGYSKQSGFVKIAHNGDYTFAAAGYARSIQILEFASLPPVPDTIPRDLYVAYRNGQLDRFFTLEI